MRLALHRVPAARVPRVPWWSVALVATWGALVAAVSWFEARSGAHVEMCAFHRATGRPCPTCGSTRAVLALVHGEPLQALAWNPLVLTGLVLLGLVLAVRAATGTRLVLDADLAARRALGVAGVLALLLNWAWVWDRA